MPQHALGITRPSNHVGVGPDRSSKGCWPGDSDGLVDRESLASLRKGLTTDHLPQLLLVVWFLGFVYKCAERRAEGESANDAEKRSI